MMAEQTGSYTLSDRATWLAMRGKSTLKILSEIAPRFRETILPLGAGPWRRLYPTLRALSPHES